MPEPLRLHGIMCASARLNKNYLCITLFDLKYSNLNYIATII